MLVHFLRQAWRRLRKVFVVQWAIQLQLEYALSSTFSYIGD